MLKYSICNIEEIRNILKIYNQREANEKCVSVAKPIIKQIRDNREALDFFETSIIACRGWENAGYYNEFSYSLYS